jgi:hypothetical protein
VTDANAKTATLEINTGFFPLAFFLFFCTPTIEIDGVPERRPWGRTRFAVAPGTRRVKIYFRYFFKAECGANEIDVTVGDGQIASVKYWMPPWMYSRGKLEVQPQLPAATARQ